ncbi:hypothetical protein U9M48_044471 [Paspalum notatum var. saurae]|uniref:Uncharacterized protein n=1 Tax=Paspalum notatum var. saurae TaxID=547442 RepID=A0AAQ3UWX1_PASNO
MATNKPYFIWGDNTADSDVVALFAGASSTAPEDAALASPYIGPAAAVARPRLRRNSAAGSAGKQQGSGARKPPQRGLGVAELERLRCGGDPLRELSAVVLGDAAQGHPLLHYPHHHNHMQVPAASAAFEPAPGAGASARYCSQMLAPPPPPAAAAGPVCFLHPHAAAPGGCQRAAPVAPEQQYFRDRWARMGSTFSTAAGGGGAAADHQPQSQLLIPAPEHPSSQSTIWRPAVSSSSCLHTGHRCDICSRRMKAMAERGALAPTATPPASPKAADATASTVSDYSIYDLATAMATARQGDAFLARERKRGAADADAPARKEVREIEFFPAASAHQTGGRVPVPDESEFAAPFYSSPYGGGAGAASHTAPPHLDLSLRL